MHYPFVREDSYWKDPAKTEHESVTTPRGTSGLDLKPLLKPSAPRMYHLCFDSDENQEDCFRKGNLCLRKASPPKIPQLKEEDIPINGLH
jgi:hypothetical protein